MLLASRAAAAANAKLRSSLQPHKNTGKPKDAQTLAPPELETQALPSRHSGIRPEAVRAPYVSTVTMCPLMSYG